MCCLIRALGAESEDSLGGTRPCPSASWVGALKAALWRFRDGWTSAHFSCSPVSNGVGWTPFLPLPTLVMLRVLFS